MSYAVSMPASFSRSLTAKSVMRAAVISDTTKYKTKGNHCFLEINTRRSQTLRVTKEDFSVCLCKSCQIAITVTSSNSIPKKQGLL
jgi:hypothetical protein